MPAELPLTEMHDLALDVAPELQQEPPYIIKHPETLPTPTDVAAYAMSGHSVAMQQHLADAGLWRGPGPVIAFVAEDLTRAELLVTLAHEVAHLLPYAHSPALPEIPTADAIDEDVRKLKAWVSEAPPRSNDKPRWTYGGHGRDFVRIALHLWWRFALRGHVLELDPLCGGMRYDLSPCYLYWRALGNEGVKMQDATFAEILAEKPPDLFNAIWYADLRAWMERNPQSLKQES